MSFPVHYTMRVTKGESLLNHQNEIFHYVVNWKENKVNQMWIQEIEESPDYYRYVAVAYNPRNNQSMVMSNPRSHYDTLLWVRKFCGSFSILSS